MLDAENHAHIDRLLTEIEFCARELRQPRSLAVWPPVQVERLWSATQRLVAAELERRIGASFRPAFDAAGRPLESYDEMKQHAAQVRELLGKYHLAVTNAAGEPCQLFAHVCDYGTPRYYLLAQGTQRRTYGRAEVAARLSDPQLVPRLIFSDRGGQRGR